MKNNNTELIKKGLFIEKTTQFIKIAIMLTTLIYGAWWSAKVLECLRVIIYLLAE